MDENLRTTFGDRVGVAPKYVLFRTGSGHLYALQIELSILARANVPLCASYVFRGAFYARWYNLRWFEWASEWAGRRRYNFGGINGEVAFNPPMHFAAVQMTLAMRVNVPSARNSVVTLNLLSI